MLTSREKSISMPGMQEFFCELKAPGCSRTQCSPFNSYDKVNPTILFGYDVQRKEKTNLECNSP